MMYCSKPTGSECSRYRRGVCYASLDCKYQSKEPELKETNGKWLRSLSDSELAKFIAEGIAGIYGVPDIDDSTIGAWEDWLSRPRD
jgi:hypothetical protein